MKASPMDRFSSLIEPFVASPALSTFSFEWLDEARRARVLQTLGARVESAAPALALADSAFEDWKSCLATVDVLSLGPSPRSRGHRPSPSFLLRDGRRPDSVFFSPGDLFPPALWIDLRQDPHRLLEALAVYLPSEPISELSHTRSVRGFLGSEQDLEMDLNDFAQWLCLHPFTENRGWGSAHESDPFVDEEPISRRSLPVVGQKEDEFAQADDSIPSISFRTKFSRSVIRIEDHEDFFVVQARYRPTSLVGSYGAQLPDDLPVDVAGVLAHLSFDDEAAIRKAIGSTSCPEDLPYLIFVLSLIKYSDLNLVEDLRLFAKHESADVRMAVADIASRMDYDFLLQEMCVLEKDRELKRRLESSL